MVDESLIAQIIVEKIQFHTPVYRFAKKLKQAGIDFIKQNNLHNWFHTGAQSLWPLYDLLIQDILAQGCLQADETRIPVLAKNKIGAAHRGQMWAFYTPTIRAVVFNYAPSRSTESARVILDHFSGTYADKSLLPKSLIRKAIHYSLSRWKGLSAYAHNGQLEIDNNLVENTIRPIALGRKNYMLAGSHDAAQNLAVLYSIIGTCEKNNINAYQYLHWLLRKVATHKITPEAVQCLPHRIDPKILEDFMA